MWGLATPVAVVGLGAPWWAEWLRRYFGPSGTIHDLGGVREATVSEVERMVKIHWQKPDRFYIREKGTEEWLLDPDPALSQNKLTADLLPNGGTFSSVMADPIRPTRESWDAAMADTREGYLNWRKA